MTMAKGRRWLLAAAVFLLVLAACTSTAGRPGPGTGTAGTPATAARPTTSRRYPGRPRISGTQSDCLLWFPFAGQVIAGPYHQVLGEGCVYPAAVQTLGNQLSAAGRSWAAYLQDMGNDPARDTTVTTARGPAVDYNHYSLLRTVEDIFGLPHLGDAAMPQVRSFGPDVLG